MAVASLQVVVNNDRVLHNFELVCVRAGVCVHVRNISNYTCLLNT